MESFCGCGEFTGSFFVEFFRLATDVLRWFQQRKRCMERSFCGKSCKRQCSLQFVPQQSKRSYWTDRKFALCDCTIMMRRCEWLQCWYVLKNLEVRVNVARFSKNCVTAMKSFRELPSFCEICEVFFCFWMNALSNHQSKALHGSFRATLSPFNFFCPCI